MILNKTMVTAENKIFENDTLPLLLHEVADWLEANRKIYDAWAIVIDTEMVGGKYTADVFGK